MMRAMSESGMKLIREKMEALVAPRTASAIIFEALAADRANSIPVAPAALNRFLAGPLHHVAVRRLGSEDAQRLLDALRAALAAGAQPERRDAAVRTLELPIGRGPVQVVVASGDASLAVALRASVGGERLGVHSVDSPTALRGVVRRVTPELVILDGTSPIGGVLEEIAAAIAALPPTSARLLWGHDHPYGVRVGEVLEARGCEFTRIDHREGVDPLLDLVRSRF